MAKKNAVCVLRMNRGKQTNRLVLKKEDTLAVVNTDSLGINRGEHVLEGFHDQLKRFVVVREVVQNEHGRSKEGSLQ